MEEKLKKVFESLPSLKSVLEAEGWKKHSMGKYVSNREKILLDRDFDFYIRRRNFCDLLEQKEAANDGFLKKASKSHSDECDEKPDKMGCLASFDIMVSNDGMGEHNRHLTPCDSKVDRDGGQDRFRQIVSDSRNLPTLATFHCFPSIASVRTEGECITIAFDSEWFYETENECDGERLFLTWQFSVIDGIDLIEYVFVRKSFTTKMTLDICIGRILEDLHIGPVDVRKVRRWSSLGDINSKTGERDEIIYDDRQTAIDNAKANFPDGRDYHIRYVWDNIEHIPVTLLCHAGKVDITTLDTSKKKGRSILDYTSEVQGGLISMYPKRLYPTSPNPKYAENRNIHKFPVLLSFRDTMCHAPAGSKSLKTLGLAVKWEKVQLEDGQIDEMDRLIIEDPIKYFEYAANDAVVTLLYASAIYGYNKKIPVTVTSAAARSMKNIMMEYLGCTSSGEFDLVYRGLETVRHGLVKKEDKLGYIEATSKEPISNRAKRIQEFAQDSYHGGYNGCFEVGYYGNDTFDYDLQNAYPVSMCLVFDTDWNDPFNIKIENRYLTLSDFLMPVVGGYNPLQHMFCYVRFEFPEDVSFPTIPVHVEGSLIYPRTSEGLNGVYAVGPELYLALCLGAKVWCEEGYVLNPKISRNGEISYALQHAVKQLVSDRNSAKKLFEKGCIEEQILKTMVNSGYGKVSQDVIQKQTWSAYSKEMEDIGCSSITNPVSASMITSIVRAELLATLNQIHGMGFKTYSLTTDGFISNIPEEVLKSLDLYGIRPFMEKARLFLTDGKDSEIWEIKHGQDDLVNFTTRGNVSLYNKSDFFEFDGRTMSGVCAHNSAKSPFESDTYEDRLWLMTNVLSRTGAVDYKEKEWTTFRDLCEGKEFKVREVTRSIKMDFDMKRKPVRDSFYSAHPVVNNVEYEIENFGTAPFMNIAEYQEYRRRKETMSCLRTADNWKMFWFKTDTKSCGMKTRNMDWDMLKSCVVGHRAGFWNIPKLNELEGSDRIDWINSFNNSNKTFTANDWKNSGRTKRQANILPKEMLQDKLDEMMME